MHLRRTAALALAAAATLAACGSSEEPAGGGAAAETHEGHEIDAEAVSLVASMAQLRGHHRVAQELYGEGDAEGALAHASHPGEEILDALGGELSEHGADVDALTAASQAVTDAIAAGAPVAEVAEHVHEAAAAAEDAGDALAGDAASDPAFEGSVVASLLATAAHEYEEAVGEEGIELVVEYQDAYGFLAEANALYDRVRTEVEEEPEEADEVEAAFVTLNEAMPAPVPPDDPVPEDNVADAAALIGHELAEVLGAVAATEADHEEVLAEISELLDRIESSYAAGDADAAAELSAEAYLENYEVIEADVIELAPELNEELEPLLGAELRRQIQAGASVEEIEAMIARARELLAQAAQVLEGAQ